METAEPVGFERRYIDVLSVRELILKSIEKSWVN